MKTKIIKLILVPTLGILSAGIITPIVMTSCGKQVPVESITLDKDTLFLGLNFKQTYQLKATVLPEDATNKKVTWSSRNEAIAIVDRQNGLVIPISLGVTTITATTVDGNKTATCKVEVVRELVPVESVSLNKSKSELTKGGVEQLIATVLPTTAPNKEITWSSRNARIASVDQTGLVTANSVGTTIITATTKDGDKTATCEVTVKPTLVEKIELNKSELELIVGKSEQLTATVLPKTATNKKIGWLSASSFVKVSQTGLVTAISPGTATITVTADDGSGIKATCKVIVKPVPVEGVKLYTDKYIELTDKDILELSEGQTSQLIATVLPEEANNKNVTWMSSDKNIASVTSNGLVTGIKMGNVTVTVTTEDGGKTATCMVKVVPEIHVSSVQLNKNKLELREGRSEQLIPTISPESATNKNVTWKSSDISIAAVDQTGVVTVTGNGTATITVTTVDGGKTATCEVSTFIPVIGIQFDKNEFEVEEGETEQLVPIFVPENATNKNVTWESSDPSIASIDTKTGLVTGKKQGYVTITVTTQDGNEKATCSLHVIKNHSE